MNKPLVGSLSFHLVIILIEWLWVDFVHIPFVEYNIEIDVDTLTLNNLHFLTYL